jgi:hypothetical protein
MGKVFMFNEEQFQYMYKYSLINISHYNSYIFINNLKTQLVVTCSSQ